MDDRIKTLAKVIVKYSCSVKSGERVLINAIGRETLALARQLVKEVFAAGASPFVDLRDDTISRELMLGCTEDQLNFESEYEMHKMKGMDAYIGIRGVENVSELADVPSEKQALHSSISSIVLHERVDNTKWVVLRYPTKAAAQMANMSLEQFEDYYFSVCNLDYAKMGKAMEGLVELMGRTDEVHIVGPGTDLHFSIKNIPTIPCSGLRNIPDGELFTAPVKDSMNGRITYNAPSSMRGFIFNNICFEVENGKIISATSNNNELLNRILDSDEGSRYFGEFAFGVNPFIKKPMNDTLFDEKICGSFHLTPGNAYDEAPNGNKSSIHWDLVCIQTPEYGGGKIFFDNVLIRDNGRFVHRLLEGLNPENLS